MKHISTNKVRSLTTFFALCALSIVFTHSAFAQAKQDPAKIKSTASTQCRGDQLSVRHMTDDAAMGGYRGIDYAFTNTSSSACTLRGYPRFELLNKSGRPRRGGRAVNREQLPGDEQKQPVQSVTLEPGKTASFRVYYYTGGAGYTGKPCPASPKVKIIAPGTKRIFVLDEEIQSCSEVAVMAVRSSLPQ